MYLIFIVIQCKYRIGEIKLNLKKLQKEVVDVIIFGIHYYVFFQQTSDFSKFSVKTNYEKT